MPICEECKTEDDVKLRYGRMRCLRCVQRRIGIAMATHFSLVRDQIMDRGGGVAVATFVDGEFDAWRCSHEHQDDAEAFACIEYPGWPGWTKPDVVI